MRQPTPSGFEASSVVCSSLNPDQRRTVWDAAKDEIIGRRNCQNIGTVAWRFKNTANWKELPYESTRRWIRVLQKQKACQDGASGSASLELLEVTPLQSNVRLLPKTGQLDLV